MATIFFGANYASLRIKVWGSLLVFSAAGAFFYFVDTPGLANPWQVKKTIGALLELGLETNFAVHFHNTRGMGLTNCLSAYEAGIRIFDAAVSGLSGTPYGAPAMKTGSWNVPTEDLVYMLEQLGVNTGIDIDAILESAKLAQKVAGIELSGHLLKARQAFLSSKFPDMRVSN